MEPFQPDEDASPLASWRFGWPFWLAVVVTGLVVYGVFSEVRPSRCAELIAQTQTVGPPRPKPLP